MWLILALGSALFAGITAILAKAGLQDTDSHLATALRTGVVLVFSWLIVFLTGTQAQLLAMGGTTWISLVLSGLATGGSWLCYFRALQTGPMSVVVPVDKLSILVTVVLSRLLFRERLSWRGWLGLGIMTAGTLCLLW